MHICVQIILFNVKWFSRRMVSHESEAPEHLTPYAVVGYDEWRLVFIRDLGRQSDVWCMLACQNACALVCPSYICCVVVCQSVSECASVMLGVCQCSPKSITI